MDDIVLDNHTFQNPLEKLQLTFIVNQLNEPREVHNRLLGFFNISDLFFLGLSVFIA